MASLDGLREALLLLLKKEAAPSQTEIQTIQPRVRWSFRNLPPPTSLYTYPEATLRVRILNARTGAQVSVRGLFLPVEGRFVEITETYNPDATRTPNDFFVRVGEGFLIGISASITPTTTQPGECFMLVELGKSTQATYFPLYPLIGGYVVGNSALTWPGSPPANPGVGRGNIRTIVGTDPAAGNEILETVPTNTIWRLMGFRAGFTAANVGVARQIRMGISDPLASSMYVVSNEVDQPINSTTRYNAGPSLASQSVNRLEFRMPFPADIIMLAGYNFFTIVNTLNAADNWSVPVLFVEEWVLTS